MITVKITQSVSHGKYHLHEGEDATLPNAIGKELVELGFAYEISANDHEDLIGAKMDAPVENKMADPVVNKAVKTTKAK